MIEFSGRQYEPIQVIAALDFGINLPMHAEKMARANPPVGSWKRQETNRKEIDCGHTEDEHERLMLIASEAVLTFALDPDLTKIETEFALQVLESDFVAIEGRPVGRPRHRDFPVYTPFRLE